MPVNFNGDVTINGNFESYDNGSVRITNNNDQRQIQVGELKKYIEETLPDSPRKDEYIEAADTLQNSSDDTLLEKAIRTLLGLVKESGKVIWLSGLSEVASVVAKRISTWI